MSNEYSRRYMRVCCNPSQLASVCKQSSSLLEKCDLQNSCTLFRGNTRAWIKTCVSHNTPHDLCSVTTLTQVIFTPPVDLITNHAQSRFSRELFTNTSICIDPAIAQSCHLHRPVVSVAYFISGTRQVSD